MHVPEPAVPEIDYQQIFSQNRIIAVVGLSARTDRPSNEVAGAMQAYGYRIIPVNPMFAGTHILGELCYATLTEAASALRSRRTRNRYRQLLPKID